MTHSSFRITGMDCADCARAIERGVAKLPGIESCALNYGSALLHVQGNIGRDMVIKRVKALGYDVKSNASAPATPAPQSRLQRLISGLPQSGAIGFVRFLLSHPNTALALLGAVLILPGLLFEELLPFLEIHWIGFELASIAALLVAGIPIALSALRTLRVNHEISINMLMVIAATGAVIIGAYTEAGMVMVLFSIGEALEGYTAERARSSIRSLMEVAPQEALVIRTTNKRQKTEEDHEHPHPSEFHLPTSELIIGDTILAKPGERIAMDGRVVNGESSVNQAPITGESVPVPKQKDSQVFAGSINGEGALEIEVTHLAQDSTLSRIIQLVEHAQDGKAPAERFVDRFARYYTPTVVLLALLVATLPPLAFALPFWGEQGWLYRALELLVVACPCALVISTPIALISAISNAASNGVLIKGGAYLEALSQVKAIAFDKTGTLTEGRPRVVQTRTVECAAHSDESCEKCDDMLAIASAVERRSEHPLARAIVDAAQAQHVDARYAPAEEVKAIHGKGVRGSVDGKSVLVGSHAYFDEILPHHPALCDEICSAAKRGVTPMLVSKGEQVLGYIIVADTVRETSRAAIAQLNHEGASTVMLTGDNAATASTVAQQVGVTEVKADLLPEHKVNAVKSLVHQYGSVAMVGDGVNDAPALATASVGIAMGGGSGQALETADVALMSNDLAKLPFVLKLARAAMRNIHINIAFAIGIKLAFLALVLLGMGSLWMAVFADVGAALLVTLNGMRLMRWRG